MRCLGVKNEIFVVKNDIFEVKNDSFEVKRGAESTSSPLLPFIRGINCPDHTILLSTKFFGLVF